MSCARSTSPTPAPSSHPDHDAPILDKLSGFLSAFAPAIGETRPAYDTALADHEASFEIVESRNLAIVAAFQAVERIARRSGR